MEATKLLLAYGLKKKPAIVLNIAPCWVWKGSRVSQVCLSGRSHPAVWLVTTGDHERFVSGTLDQIVVLKNHSLLRMISMWLCQGQVVNV